MFGKFALITFTISICLNFCYPVQANPTDEYLEALNKTWAAIESFEYEKAEGYANNAAINYKKVISHLASIKVNSDMLWKLNLSHQASSMKIYITLSQRFRGQKNYKKSLLWARKAEAVNHWVPSPHLEQATVHFLSDNPWQASISCYEAKRLSRFPIKRKITDFFTPDETFEPDVEHIVSTCDKILSSMNKSPHYPLELDFTTGKNRKGTIIPGMGAHVLSTSNDWVNVYLGQNVQYMFDSNIFGEYTESDDPDYYSVFSVGKRGAVNEYTIMFDEDRKVVDRICLSSSNYIIKTPFGDFRVGDNASKLLKSSGKTLGFERSYINERHREEFYYSEIGLKIKIGYKDEIHSICINKTDNQIIDIPYLQNKDNAPEQRAMMH